eukprot:SAG11_NODE_2110_length_3805_cov_4.091203_1_plen_103_part_00
MLLGAVFGFTTSTGTLHRAHWVSLAVTTGGLMFTSIALAWGAAARRGYGPLLLVLSAAPLLLANPTVSLLEDFGVTHRQMLSLKEQTTMLTFAGQVALLSVR